MVHVFGGLATLDQIEHGMIRAKYDEPRAHFAVNCASIGCPSLRNEAYTAEKLDAQLRQQGQIFFGDSSKNRIDTAHGRLYLSPVFTQALPARSAEAPVKNGFALTNLLIPLNEIRSGGPPRDGIPAIDNPKFIDPDKADFMKDDDMVLGVTRGKAARAYPFRILVWHEIVNDTFAGEALLVSYCPLCGTGMVFARKIGGKARRFGVSGMLYHSDVLMYDRETESLWSQIEMKAVSGPMSGTELKWLPSEQTTWEAWKKKHPGGKVLSTDTGHKRNYAAHAYARYFDSPKPMFPVPRNRSDLAEKDWIVGVIHGGKAVAFPLKDLETKGKAEFGEGNEQIRVRYDKESRHAQATAADGTVLPTVHAYWFAWQAFYPKTGLWKP